MSEVFALEHIKVSVIVPVHNAAAYLQENLTSLLAQTLKEFEIICVDDGSTDDSVSVIRRFCEKDSRVLLICQEKQNAGAARNRGIKAAAGEYMLFIDADDFVQPNLLEAAYSKAVSTNADIVVFGARKFDDAKKEYIDADYLFRGEYIPAGCEVFNRNDIPEKLYQITTPAPWTKLLRREFILREGILFQSLPNTNDAFFTMTSLAAAERISFVNQKLVNYRVGMSANTQATKKNDPLCFIRAYQAVYEELERRGLYKQLEKSYITITLAGCRHNLTTVKDPEALRQIRRGLASSGFRRSGILNHPFSYYDRPHEFYLVKMAIRDAAIEYYEEHKRLRRHAGEESTCAVSVIVPAFNSQAYLAQCLDSLIGQSLEDIEIICVNDGSTDGTLGILEEYAKRDPRVRVIDQENMGLGATRNLAVLAARGEYISFVDSDDMLKPQALEYLYGEAKENQLDVLFYDAESFYESEELEKAHPEFKVAYTRKRSYDETMSGPELFAAMRRASDYSVSAPLQLIRKNHLLDNGIDFPIGVYYEDNLFTLKSTLKAERASHRKAPLYLRRVRADSIMTATLNFHNFYSYYVCYLDMIQYLGNRRYGEETEEAIVTVFNSISRNFSNYYIKLPADQKRCLDVIPFAQRAMFKTFMLPSLEQAIYKTDPEFRKVQRVFGAVERKLVRLMGKMIAHMPIGLKRMLKKMLGRK